MIIISAQIIKPGLSKLGTVIQCLMSLVLLSSCVANRQYRTDFDPSRYDQDFKNRVVETETNYVLGFVELDDQGWLWDRKQIDAITKQCAADLKTNGLLIVTFIHGWKHNASSEDDNVETFRYMLKQLDVMEQYVSKHTRVKARRVVGVYVGWRGLSQNIPYLNNLSFWERKTVAEQIGHGAVVELLSELENVRNRSNLSCQKEIQNHQRQGTKLILMGHSFGGDMLYSAAAPILTQRMVENRDATDKSRSLEGLGDMVILINPAFEAARIETLRRLGAAMNSTTSTNCVLAIFTSTDDDATGIAFPAGRLVSTRLGAYRSKEQRQANLTAVGHYDPYITHKLVWVDKKKQKSKMPSDGDLIDSSSASKVIALEVQLQQEASIPDQIATNQVYRFSHCELSCLKDSSSPIFNVAVDPHIIPDHSNFGRGVFIRFIVEFIATFAASSEQ